MALDTNCNDSKQHKIVWYDVYGSFKLKEMQREKVSERKRWSFERKSEVNDQRNEAHPLPCQEEGIYSFTRKHPVWAAEQAYSG